MIGHCKFCGQSMITEETDEKLANNEATANCNCEAAKEWSRKQDMIDMAKSNIRGLFPEVHDDLKRLMCSVVDVIAEQHTSQVNIKVNDRVKCSIFRKGENINVKRSYKEENTLEA